MTRMGLNVSESRSCQIDFFFNLTLKIIQRARKKMPTGRWEKPPNVRMKFKSGCLKGGSESMLCTLIL